MKRYQCHKIVGAEPMSKEKFYNMEGTDTEGYKVVYTDGYVSWSPKKVFEDGYTLIDKVSNEMENCLNIISNFLGQGIPENTPYNVLIEMIEKKELLDNE